MSKDYVANLEQNVDSLEFQVEQLKLCVWHLIGRLSVNDQNDTETLADYHARITALLREDYKGVEI